MNWRPAVGTAGVARRDSADAAGTGAADSSAPRDAAGQWLAWLTVLPGLMAMAWLLVGLPLLLAGHFSLIPMLVVYVPLAAVLAIGGLRWLPDRWPLALTASREGTPWWALIGVLAVAVAFGADQMIYHSQQIIVTRDPASYIQFGNWIARHGSLPIPQSRTAFGSAANALSFGSAAFYQVGATIVPQFMAGLPMVLAAGFWAHGAGAAVALGPVLGAAAVLTFGGLAARLAGPRWAPLAALILAISLPQEFTSRSTYSEPLAQILFFGGLCLVLDALVTRKGGVKIISAIGGLALGLVLLVRIDGASDVLPVIPYGGMLLLSRRPQAIPLIGGLAMGGLYGAVDGLVLSRPYLAELHSSLVPLTLAFGLVVIVVTVAVAVLWKRGLPQVGGPWLPNAAAGLAVAAAIVFAIRPYVSVARSSPNGPDIVLYYQRMNHLPLQPYRSYAEISLHWVFWYIGVPAVVLGVAGAAVLARRCLRGQAPTWTLPLMVFAWIIVTVLYRPAISPDQPWASRRLVPGVLPGFILLAVWASAWMLGWLRQQGIGRNLRGGLAACCAAALVLPGAQTTFGLGIKTGGHAGVRVVADGMALRTTYAGEISAVDHMCAAIPRNAAVIVAAPSARRFMQVIRGMCGDPVALLVHTGRRSVAHEVQEVRQAGHQPVLIARSRAQLAPYGGAVKEIMDLHTRENSHTLLTPPTLPRRSPMRVWMSEPGT